MRDMDELDALNEGTLRRALRLEPDEQIGRLDATAIAAAAEHRTLLERLLRVTRGIALVGVSLGIESAVALAAFNVLANVDLSEPFGLALSILALAAERLVPLAALATDPAILTANLAAVVLATVYERSIGREAISVRAS